MLLLLLVECDEGAGNKSDEAGVPPPATAAIPPPATTTTSGAINPSLPLPFVTPVPCDDGFMI